MNIIKQIRELIGDEDFIEQITFSTPEDVLMWMEELTRYDIVRLSKAISVEEKLESDVTKLNAEVSKKLEKIIKLKRIKEEKGQLKWGDL